MAVAAPRVRRAVTWDAGTDPSGPTQGMPAISGLGVATDVRHWRNVPSSVEKGTVWLPFSVKKFQPKAARHIGST